MLTDEVLNYCVLEIRRAMNEAIQEINDDYTDWCELGTMVLFRLIQDIDPTASNVVARGKYKEDGHFWNIINGKIVDTTIDQFGKIKPGVINKKWLNNYVVDKYVVFDEEDLIRMTEEVFDFLEI